MNHRWSAVMVLGTFMALPLSLARADEAVQPSANEGEAYHGKHGMGHEHRDGLTDDQMAKLKSIREAEEVALKPIHRKQRDLSIKLRDQLEDKASDSAIESTLADLKATHQSMEKEAQKFMSQREAILTPTQRARMMLKHEFMRERWGHEKMDRHGEGWREDDKDDHHHDWHGRDGDDHEEGGRDN